MRLCLRSIALLVLGLGIAAASRSIAQEDRDTQPAQADDRGSTRIDPMQKPKTRSAVRLLRTSQLVGSKVNLRSGMRLGSVDELVLNSSGCTSYVIVRYQNRSVPIPWNALEFDMDERTGVVDIDENRLREIPAYIQVTSLADTEFVQRVNAFYRADGRTRERRVNGRPTDAEPKSRVGDK